jgi:Tfp pilus assembly protein PilX
MSGGTLTRLAAKRGMLLLLVLFVMGIFLIMAMGFLQQRVSQKKASTAAIEEVQARAIARSGLEDALAKLAKHHDFPPRADESQKQYRYTEEIATADGATGGAFTVAIDTRYQRGEFWLIRITSTGYLGNPAYPLAQSTCFAELDVSKLQRPRPNPSAPKVVNPNLFKFFFVKQGDAI